MIFQGLDFRRRVRVLADGLFYVNLPPAVSRALNIGKDVTADTLDEAVREWDRTIKRFIESSTTEKVVILYAFQFNVRIYGPGPGPGPDLDHLDGFTEDQRRSGLPKDWDPAKHEPTEDDIIILREDDVNFSDGVVVAVAAKTVIEREIKQADGSCRYCYDDLELDDPRNLPDQMSKSRGSNRVFNASYDQQGPDQMEWTPERHAFWCAIDGAMNSLAWKLNKLRESPDLLLSMADSGTPLLEGPKE